MCVFLRTQVIRVYVYTANSLIIRFLQNLEIMIHYTGIGEMKKF